MQQGVDTIKSTFQQLLLENGNLEASIELFNDLKAKEKLSNEDTGWILWNICDWYAMRRDAQNQFRYQSEFYQYVNTHFSPERLHWVVSDGTQARTLINGGYLFPWWHWYIDANERAPIIEQNRKVRFESHRANADAYIYFSELEKAEAALKAVDEVIREDPDWSNHDFAVVTYHTLLIDFYNATGQNNKLRDTAEQAAAYLNAWRSRPVDHARGADLLLGSWDQLNAEYGSKALPIAIHNAACALARTDQLSSAERLFRILLSEGTELTPYAQALLVQACWKIRHDRKEITDMLSTFTSLTPELLQKFAPEIITVIHDYEEQNP